MFSLFIMPKRRTFEHSLASSEDKLFFVKKEDMSSKRKTYMVSLMLTTRPTGWPSSLRHRYSRMKSEVCFRAGQLEHSKPIYMHNLSGLTR